MGINNNEFSQYLASFPVGLERIRLKLNVEGAEELLSVSQRLSYKLEHLGIPKTLDTQVRSFLLLILPKLTQELYASYGCLQFGSLYGFSHHMRAIIELYAMGSYVLREPQLTPHRLRKFSAFRHLEIYLRFKKLRSKLRKKSITVEQFCERNIYKPADIKQAASNLKNYRALWKTKSIRGLSKIRNWHHPAKVDNLLEETELGPSVRELYGNLCHLTHISPLSDGVVRSSLFIQPDQEATIGQYIKVILFCAWEVCGLVDICSATSFREDIFDNKIPALKTAH